MPDNKSKIPVYSEDTYVIEGDEELEDMYSRLHFPKFPPFESSVSELEQEEDENEETTAASQASLDEQ